MSDRARRAGRARDRDPHGPGASGDPRGARRIAAALLSALLVGCGAEPDGARRLLVVGWDGATWDLIDPLLEAGRMPNLAGLLARGTRAELESTIVPISSAAWTAATTGMGPGASGVYSFFEPVEGSYDVRLISAGSNRATPIWRTLARRGRRSVVWGVPVTYPPEPIPGVMVAGMLAPFEAAYAHPPELADELRARGFKPDLGMWTRNRADHDPAVVERQLTLKEAALGEALAREDWTLAWVVYKNLDVLSHGLFDGSPAGRVAGLVERLDRSLGLLLDAVGPDANVILLSDHGFRNYRQVLHLYNWLVTEGFSVRRASAPPLRRAGGALGTARAQQHAEVMATLDLDRTQAFARASEGHFGSVRLNLAGREPRGTVAPEEADRVLDRIAERLLALRTPGPNPRPIVRAVHRARELYPGPYAGDLPDLLFETDPAVAVRADPGQSVLVELGPPGLPDHDRRGILALCGPDVRAGVAPRTPSILDVAPTALALLGLPAYDAVQGRALAECLAVPVPARVSEADDGPNPPAIDRYLLEGGTLSSAELDEIQRRLEELGYTE